MVEKGVEKGAAKGVEKGVDREAEKGGAKGPARKKRGDAAAGETGDETASSSKKRGLMTMILLGGFVLVLLAGGYVAYTTFLARPTSEAKASARPAGKEGNRNEPGPIIPMKTFIVNLADTSGKRYLKLNMEIEISDKELQKEIDQRQAQMRDSILVLLSSKRYADISTSLGKNQLRSQLIARLNKLLPRGEVKQLYFTEFVVQ
ncbi:MAG: flagellar basal body-associated FliL family protein [Candidatus Tectomicrobia bacterium]|nr:flagellar basal body-associated FliL family protein [Candidatus Tectomicrobia bacterium]